MYYNRVEICGVNTADLITLSDKEKKELLIECKKGNSLARQKLIDGNLRLVLSIVQRFGNRGENPDDLFQVGCIGLIKAVDNFNIELDVKFSTYAVPMIIGEIRRYLRDNNVIRVSRSVRDLAYHALSAKEHLSKANNREVTIKEIVKYLNSKEIECTEEKVTEALEAIVDPVSLYEPVFNDQGGSESLFVLDQISDRASGDELWLESIALSEAIKKLSEREKSIIAMRFYEGKTQMEIAEEIGISQAQVSRLEKGAISRIRKDF